MLMRGTDIKARNEVNLAAFEAVASVIAAVEKAYGVMDVPVHNDNLIGYEKFGERLRHLCAQRPYSHEFIADNMGVARNSIGRWMKGEEYPVYWSIVKIAKYFNVTPNWLLTGKG